ncbi:MAG: DUF86 domain-containing protein [Ferruginibacter sp.]
MKGKIGDRQRLLHILDSITEIENYTINADLELFLKNSMMRYATIKQIEIIGEAANYISEETKNKFTDIEWKQIIGLRHILIHEYFGVDDALIWQVVVSDIPTLKVRIDNVLKSIP